MQSITKSGVWEAIRFRMGAILAQLGCKFLEATRMDSPDHHPKPAAIAPPFRRGLSRAEAAGYVGLSTSGFDRLVQEKKMPRPKHVGGRRIWDVRALDVAFDQLDPNSADANPWD